MASKTFCLTAAYRAVILQPFHGEPFVLAPANSIASNLQSALRHGLTLGAGILLARGAIHPEQVDGIISLSLAALTAIGGLGWSVARNTAVGKSIAVMWANPSFVPVATGAIGILAQMLAKMDAASPPGVVTPDMAIMAGTLANLTSSGATGAKKPAEASVDTAHGTLHAESGNGKATAALADVGGTAEAVSNETAGIGIGAHSDLSLAERAAKINANATAALNAADAANAVMSASEKNAADIAAVLAAANALRNPVVRKEA